MVKVTIADGLDFRPVVTEVKGVRGGHEGVANEMQDALACDLDGKVRVRWGVIQRCVNGTFTVC